MTDNVYSSAISVSRPLVFSVFGGKARILLPELFRELDGEHFNLS